MASDLELNPVVRVILNIYGAPGFLVCKLFGILWFAVCWHLFGWLPEHWQPCYRISLVMIVLVPAGVVAVNNTISCIRAVMGGM
jgi:hypothetical protein